LLGGFEQAANLVLKSKKKKQPENSEMATFKLVRIRPKYSATVAFL